MNVIEYHCKIISYWVFSFFSIDLNKYFVEYHNQNISTNFSQKPIGISVATVLSSTHGQKLNEEVAGSPTQNSVDIIKLDESEMIEPEVSDPLLGKNTCYRAQLHISIE